MTPISAPEQQQQQQQQQPIINTWNIAELSAFFAALAPIPTEHIQLNGHTTIVDVQKFIDTSLTRCIHNNGSRRAKQAYERLCNLRVILSRKQGECVSS